MNDIDALVKKLCPKGVEFKELNQVFQLRNGYTPSTKNPDYWEGGDIPWFRMEDIRTHGRVLDKAIQCVTRKAVKSGRLFPANSILIATSATIGEHALVTVPHLSNQRFTSLTLRPEFSHHLNMKFVFYYCFLLREWCKENTNISSFQSVNMTEFKKFPFPIPPLEIQQEIVAILDTFSELEAELEARKKQYEYYRDELLSFGDEVEWVSLEAVCLSMLAGGDLPSCYSKGQTKPSEEFPYPIFSNGTDEKSLYGYSDSYRIDEEAVTVSARGTIGFCAVRSPYFTPIVRLVTLIPDKQQVSAKYLKYILEKVGFNHSGGSIPQLTIPNIKTVKIPLPSLKEQQEIVSILDDFDTLVNDLSIGLPAEIAARRKQYEYYRDQLLNFPERS